MTARTVGEMNHQSKTSLIAGVIRAAVNEVVEPDYVSPCKTKNVSCKLATGIEGLFVTNIVSQLLRSIQKTKPEWAFHQFVYMPSTSIEGKCGFDVSFGHFENASGHRVRLMHKLITEWCDEDWAWNSNQGTQDEARRCADHVFKLVKQFRDSGQKSRPFLSFSVCYCLHEFRRMGSSKDIPQFENARRSLFVDLSALAEVLPDNFDSKNPRGRLVVSHKVKDAKSPLSACWVSGDGKTQTSLQVLDWPGFKKFTDTFLL